MRGGSRQAQLDFPEFQLDGGESFQAQLQCHPIDSVCWLQSSVDKCLGCLLELSLLKENSLAHASLLALEVLN